MPDYQKFPKGLLGIIVGATGNPEHRFKGRNAQDHKLQCSFSFKNLIFLFKNV